MEVLNRTVLVCGLPISGKPTYAQYSEQENQPQPHGDDRQFYNIFTFCGKITFLSFDREEGKAVVCFSSSKEARDALMLDNTLFKGCPLQISTFNGSENPKLASRLGLALGLPQLLVSETETSPFDEAEEKNMNDTKQHPRYKETDFLGLYDHQNKKSENEHGAECQQAKLCGKEKDTEPETDNVIAQKQNQHYNNVQAIKTENGEKIEKLDAKLSILEPICDISNYETIRLEFDKGRITYQGKGLLYNFRDLSFVTSSKTSSVQLRGGIFYRSACWSRRASLTSEEVKILLRFLQDACNIRTYLDLRSKIERLEDKNEEEIESFIPTITNIELFHYHAQRASDATKTSPRLPSSSSSRSNTATHLQLKRFFVDLVSSKFKQGLMMTAPSRAYVKIVKSTLSPSTKSRALSTLSNRSSNAQSSTSLEHCIEGDSGSGTESEETESECVKEKQSNNENITENQNEKAARKIAKSSPSSFSSSTSSPRTSVQYHTDTASKIFVNAVFNEKLGLLGLNKLILQYAQKEIRNIFSVLLNKQNHPLLIHCKSGKDRTGLVVALILSVCGVERELIIEDYAQSESYLQEDNIMAEIIEENRARGLNEKFDGSPKEVMQEILNFIDEKWGSVSKYLNDACQVSYVEQHYLRRLLALSSPRPL
jgi:hypothetical protein